MSSIANSKLRVEASQSSWVTILAELRGFHHPRAPLLDRIAEGQAEPKLVVGVACLDALYVVQRHRERVERLQAGGFKGITLSSAIWLPRAKPSGPERRRPAARRIAIAPPPPPSIPTESELRTQYEHLPGYRLLVLYLGRFTPEAAIMFKNLSPAEQEAVRAFHPGFGGTPPKPPRRWEPDLDRPVQRRDARGRTVVVYPYEKKRELKRGGPPAFHLALAWVLMERENQVAARDRQVIPVLAELAREWNCAHETLLRLSYLPQRVLRLHDVFLQAVAERSEEANKVRRYRQLEARDQPLPEELLRLSLTSLRQERAWWKALGFDKESESLARQGIWTDFSAALINAVGSEDRDRASGRVQDLRRLSCRAWQIFHARYPELSLPGPELIRKRYRRPPCRS